MALFDRDLNILDASSARRAPAATRPRPGARSRDWPRTAQLEKDLRDIERRIEKRLEAVRTRESFRDSAVDVVAEFSDLEEDRFWRDEIATRLQEHLDELHARQSLRKEQDEIARRSSESSPAKRDAAYALEVYTADREFEIATRKRLDGDEMSEAYAATLQKREEALLEAERSAKTQGEKKNVRLLGRLFAKLRRGSANNDAQRRK